MLSKGVFLCHCHHWLLISDLNLDYNFFKAVSETKCKLCEKHISLTQPDSITHMDRLNNFITFCFLLYCHSYIHQVTNVWMCFLIASEMEVTAPINQQVI